MKEYPPTTFAFEFPPPWTTVPSDVALTTMTMESSRVAVGMELEVALEVTVIVLSLVVGDAVSAKARKMAAMMPLLLEKDSPEPPIPTFVDDWATVDWTTVDWTTVDEGAMDAVDDWLG